MASQVGQKSAGGCSEPHCQQLTRVRAGHIAPSRFAAEVGIEPMSVGSYTVNDAPQPHDLFTFGLWRLKPDCISPSL